MSQSLCQQYASEYPNFDYIKIPYNHYSKKIDVKYEKARAKKLEEAYEELSGAKGFFNKAFAGLATGIMMFLLGALFTFLLAAVGCILYLPVVVVYLLRPQLFILPTLKDKGIGARALMSLLAPLGILFGSIAAGFVASGFMTYESYTEMAVRGRGKSIVAMTSVILTAALFVLCPPAGTAATVGVGGSIAATLGMQYVNSGAWAFLFSGLVAAATYALHKVKSWAKTLLCKCLTPCLSSKKYTFSEIFGEDVNHSPAADQSPMSQAGILRRFSQTGKSKPLLTQAQPSVNSYLPDQEQLYPPSQLSPPPYFLEESPSENAIFNADSHIGFGSR